MLASPTQSFVIMKSKRGKSCWNCDLNWSFKTFTDTVTHYTLQQNGQIWTEPTVHLISSAQSAQLSSAQLSSISSVQLSSAQSAQLSSISSAQLNQLSSSSAQSAQLSSSSAQSAQLNQLSSNSSSAQCIIELAQLTAQQNGKMLSRLMSWADFWACSTELVTCLLVSINSNGSISSFV